MAVSIEYQAEFGRELQIVVPYAYYLFQQGQLLQTTSCSDTQCFYYFSTLHTEKYASRNQYVNPINLGFPNPTEHVSQLNTEKWIAPPYRDVYRNDHFRSGRDLVVINNKYNMEWSGGSGEGVYNFIDVSTLESLILLLKDDHQIVYNRPTGSLICKDIDQLDLNEFELLAEYPEVITTQQLQRENPNLSFNTLQMMVMANCQKFISVQGGNSVLASYFGGDNIVFITRGSELEHGDYDHYPLFAGTKIYLCQTYHGLLTEVEKRYCATSVTAC